MADNWEVEFAPGVIDDLQGRCADPLDAVLVFEWLLAMERRLVECDGLPADGFLVYTTNPVEIGTVVEGRLLGLFRHHRLRFRTWRNLWLRPRERCIIRVSWVTLLAVSVPR